MTHQTPYESRLIEAIKGAVSSGPKQFTDIVRSCKGAYPTTVLGIMAKLQPDIALASHSLWQTTKLNSPGWQSLLSKLEGNPVLSSWYFTADTCERIGKLRDWSNANIGFLGTPRLYEWFVSNQLGGRRLLLELDSVVLAALADLADNEDNAIQPYDAAHDLPEDARGKFDVVFMDPPWYPDDYTLWFNRAAQLAPSGIVFSSLFPELLRPSAMAERHTVVERFRSPDSFLLMSSFLEYEIPSFERVELRTAGILELRPWKLADLMVSTVRSSEQVPSKGVDECSLVSNWHEVDIGTLRIFINTAREIHESEDLLSCPDGHNIVLPSPSRRNPWLNHINVLTSRGHGLASAAPKRLLQVLTDLARRPTTEKPEQFIAQRFPSEARAATVLSRILEEKIDG